MAQQYHSAPGPSRDAAHSSTPDVCFRSRSSDLHDRSERLKKELQALHDSIEKSVSGNFAKELRKLREEIREKKGKERIELLEQVVVRLKDPHIGHRRMVLSVLGEFKLEAKEILYRECSSHDPLMAEAALCCAGFLSRGKGDEETLEMTRLMQRLLSHTDARVSESAAIGLRYINSSRAREALFQHACAGRETSRHSLSQLGLCQSSDALGSVLSFFKEERVFDLPPQVAFLLTGSWLAEHLHDVRAVELGARFGFLDQRSARLVSMDEIEGASELLRKIGVLTTHLLDAYGECRRSSREDLIECWAKRKMDLSWALLPEEVKGGRVILPVKLEDSVEAKIDQDLLFAALRESDKTNIDLKCSLDPFNSRNVTQIPGRFFYLSYSCFREAYFNQYLKTASALIPKEFFSEEARRVISPHLVTSLAAVDCETREEHGREALELCLARWKAGAVLLDAEAEKELSSAEVEELVPVSSPLLLKYGVSSCDRWRSYDEIFREVKDHASYERLSLGARSAINLLAYTDNSREELERESERLCREEMQAHKLPSVGIEIQSGAVPVDRVQGIKAAFEYLGVPSPKRPEFLGVTEASFRPVRAAAALTVGARVIREEFFKSPERLALHFSWGGDLGEQAKYIALPLFLGNHALVERIRSGASTERILLGLKNLMSKGLIARSVGLEDACGEKILTGVRTEIRVAALGEEKSLAAEACTSEFFTNLQLLGAAALAFERGKEEDGINSDVVAVWSKYQRAQHVLMSEAAESLFLFMESDWYESTGCCRDERLLSRISIVKTLLDAAKWLAENPSRHAELQERSEKLFAAAANEVRALEKIG